MSQIYPYVSQHTSLPGPVQSAGELSYSDQEVVVDIGSPYISI